MKVNKITIKSNGRLLFLHSDRRVRKAELRENVGREERSASAKNTRRPRAHSPNSTLALK